MRIVKISDLSDEEKEKWQQQVQARQQKREESQKAVNENRSGKAFNNVPTAQPLPTQNFEKLVQARQTETKLPIKSENRGTYATDSINKNTVKEVQKKAVSNVGKDILSLGKLVGLGVVSGAKQIPNYLENASDQLFASKKKLNDKMYLSSSKVDDLEKMNYYAQNPNFQKTLQQQETQERINELSKSRSLKDTQYNTQLPVEKVETNLVKKAIQDSINKDNEQIQQEQQQLSNPITRKLGEIAPSMGQMLPGTALSAVNPVLGTTYFTMSAAGGYIDDAKARGMTDEQAFQYGTIMGTLEGASEAFITGQQLSKVSKAFAGKEISKNILESYGFNIFENAVQEAVMEPAQEITAGIIGDKADWSNMGERMMESGFNGALMGAISNGVTYGLEKSGKVYQKIKNGEKVTEAEYREALQENIDRFGKEAVEQNMKKRSDRSL